MFKIVHITTRIIVCCILFLTSISFSHGYEIANIFNNKLASLKWSCCDDSATFTWKFFNLELMHKLSILMSIRISITYCQSFLPLLKNSLLDIPHTLSLYFLLCLSHTPTNCEELCDFLIVICWWCSLYWFRLFRLLNVIIVVLMNNILT